MYVYSLGNIYFPNFTDINLFLVFTVLKIITEGNLGEINFTDHFMK